MDTNNNIFVTGKPKKRKHHVTLTLTGNLGSLWFSKLTRRQLEVISGKPKTLLEGEKKSATTDSYAISQDENGTISVYKRMENMEDVREVLGALAEDKHINVSPKLDTTSFIEKIGEALKEDTWVSGNYLVQSFGSGDQYGNGSYIVDVYQLCGNSKSALRDIAEKEKLEYDSVWNTRMFGSKLIDMINEKYQVAEDSGEWAPERGFQNVSDFQLIGFWVQDGCFLHGNMALNNEFNVTVEVDGETVIDGEDQEINTFEYLEDILDATGMDQIDVRDLNDEDQKMFKDGGEDMLSNGLGYFDGFPWEKNPEYFEDVPVIVWQDICRGSSATFEFDIDDDFDIGKLELATDSSEYGVDFDFSICLTKIAYDNRLIPISECEPVEWDWVSPGYQQTNYGVGFLKKGYVDYTKRYTDEDQHNI